MTTSYDKQNEDMVIACDTEGCAGEDSCSGSFMECIQEFKSRDWKTFKVDGEWKNSCPACFENWKLNSFAKKVEEDKKVIYPTDDQSQDIPF